MNIINLLCRIYNKLYLRIFYRLKIIVSKRFSYEYSYNHLIKKIGTKNILTKEQKKEIDNFYKKHYGKKISYAWHNCFTKYSGKFDVKYIPNDIFKDYLYSINIKDKTYYEILQDKNFIYKLAESADVKVPKRYFYSINNLFFDSDNNLISKQDFYKRISNIGEVFIKPTQISFTGNAKNCKILKIVNGIDTISKTSIKEIIEKNYNMDFVVQEKIICHKSISALYPKSVNTIGLNTIILNNEIKAIKTVLKIGMNGNLFDYGGTGNKGLLIPIKQDGTLYDRAFCLSEQKEYFSHPDTGITFKDYKIDVFPKVLETAKKFQASLPWMPFCGLDLVINEKGEVLLIEMESPSCSIVQSISGESFFGNYTEQILSSLKKK